jgi:CheY-like chemotaxis protein/two-component sensor histidine kinase
VIWAVIDHATRLSSLEEKERELAAILHDVRAPVGGLKYLLTELSSGGVEQAWAAAGIRHELAYMENLLATISPAQGENGRFQLEHCDVDQVVRRVVDRCMVEGSREGLEIVVESSVSGISARVPDVELERVLSNILGNAIRYSTQGKVSLSIRADRSRVVIAVSDTGPGIEPRILKELQDPQSKTVSNATGWGMGLISSKRRIERYGGDLYVTSSTEHGTTIEVCASRGPDLRVSVSEREVPSLSMACGDSVDLIIVDDDEQQVASLQRVLTRSGLSVRGATSIAEAASLVDSTSVRAVLCDATMPDGGALQLMEIFKERGVKSKVAVASGDGSEDLLYRCAAQGAREFFCKPVEIEPLLSWVRSEHVER